MYNESEKMRKKKKNNKKSRRFFFIPLKDNERVLSNTEKKYFKILNSELIINVLLIMIGIILCFNDFESNIYLGLIMIMYGLVKGLAFLLKNSISLYNFNILYAIVSIIIGIMTIFFSANIMLGIWLILMVMENLELAFRLKKVEEKSWNFVLMSSVLMLFISILLISDPFVNLSIYQVMGAFLILYGVLSSTKIFMLKNRSYNFI